MATATTINGFNVGTDIRFAVTDDYGDVFTDQMLGHMTEFSSESEDVELKITPITTGGVPIYQTLWNGIRGTMMFTRVGPSFTAMFIDLANGYQQQGIIPQFSIAAAVRNRDSSMDDYIYSGVQFSKPKFGDYRATKEVDMRVDFKAGSLQATGTLATFLSALASS